MDNGHSMLPILDFTQHTINHLEEKPESQSSNAVCNVFNRHTISFNVMLNYKVIAKLGASTIHRLTISSIIETI